ncbi:MAG: zinc ribbon domain-containing protein [Clostridiales bacterium]|nr:zinc ribbon domain-containing protein [Clostridia bacterium]MCR4884304.1 zinc ribbon domain-containing protein [Clostridiales bacterium]
MGKLVMAYWDCPFCGSTGIRGDAVQCPNCGRPRGDVKFYMKDHADQTTRKEGSTGDIEYISEEKAKTINRNPDWYCSFCNTLNSDNAAFCSNCGASRENSESNYFDIQKKKEEEARREAAAAAPAPTRTASSGGKRPILLLIVAVLAIVGLFSFLNSNKTSGDLKVTALAWQRDIQIEENIQYSESGWTLPAFAEKTSERQELHHYDQVLDHYENVEVTRSRQVFDHYDTYYTYEDRGNGTFEEISHSDPVYRTEYYTETVSEPVYVPVPRYATKYYYNIWRWTPTRTATASGTDHNTAWPDTNLTENEREGDRAELYAFTVENKDHQLTTYRLAESDWMNVNVGDGMYITAKRTGADAYISDKDGNRIADIVRIR